MRGTRQETTHGFYVVYLRKLTCFFNYGYMFCFVSQRQKAHVLWSFS